MAPGGAHLHERRKVVGVLAVAVLAVSLSGPLIAFAAAPALAIAFWRTALAVAGLGPVAATRRRHELSTLVRGPARAATLVAGLALAVHFAAWVPSVTLTTIAAATALVATQPVWQGLIARLQGRRLPGRTWAGIGLAMAGAIAATGVDLTVSAQAVAGDLLALAGGIAAAIYTAAGERVRASASTTAYTTVCYAVCAAVLGMACLLGRVPLAGYPAVAWLAIGGLVVGPQLLGHSMFSYALRQVPATTISVLILLEVPAASVIGWLWLGQAPRPATLPALMLLLAGVALVVYGRRPTGGGRLSPGSTGQEGSAP